MKKLFLNWSKRILTLTGKNIVFLKTNEFCVLGITFPKDLKDIVKLNYKSKIEEMKKLFLNWSKRILTPT